MAEELSPPGEVDPTELLAEFKLMVKDFCNPGHSDEDPTYEAEATYYVLAEQTEPVSIDRIEFSLSGEQPIYTAKAHLRNGGFVILTTAPGPTTEEMVHVMPSDKVALNELDKLVFADRAIAEVYRLEDINKLGMPVTPEAVELDFSLDSKTIRMPDFAEFIEKWATYNTTYVITNSKSEIVPVIGIGFIASRERGIFGMHLPVGDWGSLAVIELHYGEDPGWSFRSIPEANGIGGLDPKTDPSEIVMLYIQRFYSLLREGRVYGLPHIHN